MRSKLGWCLTGHHHKPDGIGCPGHLNFDRTDGVTVDLNCDCECHS